jgi:outer membrane receptor protein involved in Fe transport
MARRRQTGPTSRRLTDSERLILNPKRHLIRALGLGLIVTSSAWAQAPQEPTAQAQPTAQKPTAQSQPAAQEPTAQPQPAAQPQPTDEDLVLPPVDVQAQRRFAEYRLLNSDLFKVPSELADYPQTVTIVPQELMREQAAFTLRDSLRNVTGIGFIAGEGGGAQGDNLTLRGFSARTDIFLDGIRDVGMYTRDVFNLEAVEVFKGPSALLFGRGSTGGVINQVSKTPKTSRFYEGSFTGGTDVFFRGQADVNQPIGSVAALRLNIMGQTNDIAGRDEVDIKRWGIAPSFTVGFGTPVQVTGSFYYQREDNLPDYGFPVMFGGQIPSPPLNRENFYGLADHDYEKTDVYIGTLRVDYKYSDDFRLRNMTRYGWYGREALPGVPQPPTVAPNQSRGQHLPALARAAWRTRHGLHSGARASRAGPDPALAPHARSLHRRDGEVGALRRRERGPEAPHVVSLSPHGRGLRRRGATGGGPGLRRRRDARLDRPRAGVAALLRLEREPRGCASRRARHGRQGRRAFGRLTQRSAPGDRAPDRTP